MQAAKASWKRGIMPALSHDEPLLECKTGNLNVACGMSGEAPFITLINGEGQKLAWGVEGAMSILPETVEPAEESMENVRRIPCTRCGWKRCLVFAGRTSTRLT